VAFSEASDLLTMNRWYRIQKASIPSYDVRGVFLFSNFQGVSGKVRWQRARPEHAARRSARAAIGWFRAFGRALVIA
jgi:hypothetical protein